MIILQLINGQLTEPQPVGAIAIHNTGSEVRFYFTPEELPEWLYELLYPPEEDI